MMTIDEIRDNFALLDDWDDRYRYVIELGRTLAPMPETEHSAANKVQGCASQVWLSKQIHRGIRRIRISRAPDAAALQRPARHGRAHSLRRARSGGRGLLKVHSHR